IAEEFSMSGVDYLYIDRQHGIADSKTVVEMLRAAEKSAVSVLIRVPLNDEASIASALDSGAHGVIVPMIEDRKDAQAAVRASRYFPDGTRSWGPIRARYGLGDVPAIVNQEILCLVMVETQRSLD